MAEIKGRFIISSKEKPCCFCKKMTKLIEIKTEKRICSEECLRKLDDITSSYKAIYVRFCGFNANQFDIIDKIFLIDENVFNLLMKASDENFFELFIKISNFLGDYSLLNSKLLDELVETGDIICFEKNKKSILNKSKKVKCFLNVEAKTLNSYLTFQAIELSNMEYKKFQNAYIINQKFT